MPHAQVNGADLYYEVAGDGEPLVLVHGSWTDHNSWRSVVPALAASYRVVTYDRRGHGRSTGPAGPGARTQDEDDLAALLERLDMAPAHVVANSFGASTALGRAARRPEVFRSLVAHEPPLLETVAGDPELEPLMREMGSRIDAVVDSLRAGDDRGGVYRFVEEVALGPGMWAKLPAPVRETFVGNAATFLDEQNDPHWAAIDPSGLSTLAAPVLLTHGTASPAWFPKIIGKLADAIPHARVAALNGAGHVPHSTHPEQYVATVTGFLADSS
ncbi:alpha/beta fold hydrolase [Embleya scabrispora]|uniref:alpha/beta fold hydrolase n=1 Tax=Embleya scabrispora TaxID=159449 RepID=UPI0003A8BF8A|nr:alpha/beta hydrolase [Embleya scabrispora]MYS84857.1 alpha/beta fold hydrolase [Streptomyces sp. SID5474]